jgi:hypothetical protein
VYCLVQFIDLDPIDWDNIYNRIIGTLGNPNFSASALSGFAVMWLFGTRRVEKDSGLIRYLHWIVAISLGILAISTESLQALVLLALGMVLFAFSKMREKNAGSFIPYLLIGSGGLLGLFMFLSFSGLGPLSSVFEQQTLKLRFWYAYFALRGIIENPLIGQGVDNYAYVYRRFRTKEFVEQYGSTLYSDNAHSTPFQVGSSFGALVLIIYLLLNFIALIKALAILNSPNVNFHSQKRIAALWILVFFQSLLSIEIIGLAVLNWLLSAFLLALPKNEFELVRKAARQRTTENPSSEMPPWVGALTLISFLLSSVPSFIVYKENQIVRVLSQSFTNNKENINFIRDEFHKLTGLTTQTPINVFQILNNLYLAQMTNEVESMLVELVAVEKRNIFAKDMLATHYQNMKDYP